MSWWDGISNYFSTGDGWGDLFGAVLGGLSSVSSSKESDKQARTAGEYGLRQIREGGMENRRNTEHETRLAKWLKDKEKEDRRKGLSNYARFSSVDYGPPSYIPPEVGEMPTASGFDASAYDERGNRRPLYQNVRGGG